MADETTVQQAALTGQSVVENVPDPTTSRGPSEAAQERAATDYLRERRENNNSYAQPQDPSQFETVDEREFRDRDLHLKDNEAAVQHARDRAAERAQEDAAWQQAR